MMKFDKRFVNSMQASLPSHIFKSEVFTNISFLVYVLHAYFVWHWGTRLKELIEPLLLYSSLTDIFGRLMMACVVVAFALLIWLVMSLFLHNC